MTQTTRRTGWLVLAALVALALVQPVTLVLNGPPSEGPFPFCELAVTTVAGLSWWLVSRRRTQPETTE